MAQDRGQQQYDTAYDAWDAGRYPEALKGFQQLLGTPDGERFVEPIALLTGELYRSIEVVPPNRLVVDSSAAVNGPQWSPDGRHFAFESTAAGRRTIRIYRIENGASLPVATLDGHAVSFAFDGTRVAFLRIVEDEELKAARAAGGGPGSSAAVRNLEAAKVAVIERDLTSDRETILSPPDTMRRLSVHYASDNRLFVTANPSARPDGDAVQRSDIYALSPTGTLELLIAPGQTAIPAIPVQRALSGGRLLVGFGRGFGIVNPADKTIRSFAATSYSASATGEDVVFLTTRRVEQPAPVVPLAPPGQPASPQSIDQNSIQVVSVSAASPPKEVIVTPLRVANPVISPNGRSVAFQMMPREDWELYVADVDRKSDVRITNEIQHDHTPRFLTDRQLLGVMGETRHRRSYVYDVETGHRTRLFHNNLLRTLAMEHSWAVSPDGSRVLIVADRDGDTISPERGVYVLDLTAKVGKAEILERLARMLSEENDLRERGRRMFAAIAADVREVLHDASVTRVYGYEKDLVAFGSKYITQPGNKLAADYIFNTLGSFGYEPQYQYFEVPNQENRRSAPRTSSPRCEAPRTPRSSTWSAVTTIRSWAVRGPTMIRQGRQRCWRRRASCAAGRCRQRSSSSGLPARKPACSGAASTSVRRPQRETRSSARSTTTWSALQATIVWTTPSATRTPDCGTYSTPRRSSSRISSPTMRSTTRGRMPPRTSRQYGDIVAGIGSHPILGSPHYHQPHDVLETVSIPLITEVARATAASIMLMASSPSRVTGAAATMKGAGAEVTWTPSPEKNVTAYVVRHRVDGQPRDIRVTTPRATLSNARAGDEVWVKAVNARGMEGWDWQRVNVK